MAVLTQHQLSALNSGRASCFPNTTRFGHTIELNTLDWMADSIRRMTPSEVATKRVSIFPVSYILL